MGEEKAGRDGAKEGGIKMLRRVASSQSSRIREKDPRF